MIKKFLQGLVLITCVAPIIVAHAAHKEDLTGSIESNADLLKKFSLVQTLPIHEKFSKGLALAPDLSEQKNVINTLQLSCGYPDNAESIVRYNQYYHDVPVWGMQIIYAITPHKTTMVRGMLIEGIEKDVPDVNNTIPMEQIKRNIRETNNVSADIAIEKVIYYDENISNQAILAYHVSYLAKTAAGISIITSFYDATNGQPLGNKWDQLPTGNT